MRRVLRPLAAVAAMLVALTACAVQSPAGVNTPTARPSTSVSTPTSATADSASTTVATANGSVTYDVTGSGTALTVDYSPDAKGAAERIESVPLPWTKNVPVVGSPTLYEVVIVGGDNVACRILLGDKVVAQQPVGGTSHCIYQP